MRHNINVNNIRGLSYIYRVKNRAKLRLSVKPGISTGNPWNFHGLMMERLGCRDLGLLLGKGNSGPLARDLPFFPCSTSFRGPGTGPHQSKVKRGRLSYPQENGL
jgi:hypothetical protein